VAHLLQPVDAEEYWGAGVTYERSRLARMAESQSADVYARIYQAERPELFFKATPSRCVGPNQAVGIRADSRWSVPEPELALVVDGDGTILGYTLGNDMSARDIEGDNPLYLPQAKVYQACCAIGPTVLLAEGGQHPTFEIQCRILRNGEEVFNGSTSTARMRRSFDELATYLRRHNPLPAVTVLLTGTGIVPPDEFTLLQGDVVEISSPPLGVLRNPVEQVETAQAAQR
jgi:2-dehydro-3-deoxy-D-arabinonate dehydratase